MRKKKGFQDFLREEDGMGTVEVILIIVVLVGLVILFKSQVTTIVQSLFGKITAKTDKL
ncbi:MAG: Flp1 family type IVb pilin [Lachnospiraceae bacterium]|nr:Flp1 family type IVb pilin [Lachnospiraceae bacterium]